MAGTLPGNFVQTVFVDAGNRVWVGVEGKGLSVLDADRRGFRQFSRATHPLIAQRRCLGDYRHAATAACGSAPLAAACIGSTSRSA